MQESVSRGKTTRNRRKDGWRSGTMSLKQARNMRCSVTREWLSSGWFFPLVLRCCGAQQGFLGLKMQPHSEDHEYRHCR